MAISVNRPDVAPPTDPRVSLLDLLREELQLTGTKKGCNQRACGACTALVDGERKVSCLSVAVQCDGREVTTTEGLSRGGQLHRLQGRCIETDRERMSGNICRCGDPVMEPCSYTRANDVRSAISGRSSTLPSSLAPVST